MDVLQQPLTDDTSHHRNDALLFSDLEDLVEDILEDIEDLEIDESALHSPSVTTEDVFSVHPSKPEPLPIDEFVRRLLPQPSCHSSTKPTESLISPSLSHSFSLSLSRPSVCENTEAIHADHHEINDHSLGHCRGFSLHSNASTLSTHSNVSMLSASTTSTVLSLRSLRSSSTSITGPYSPSRCPSTVSLIEARLAQLAVIERVLMDHDVQSCGFLDIDSFHDAVTDIDPDCSSIDIELIFERITASHSTKLSVAAFIEFMDNALRRYRSPKQLQNPMRAFHAAFPDLFAHRDGPKMRVLWGDAQIGSLHKLLSELEEEAQSEGVIDFPEFMAALSNMGIDADRGTMQRVFEHVLRPQSAKGLQDEVDISLLMRLLEQRVKRHSRCLKPRALIHLTLMDLARDSGVSGPTV